MLTNQSRYLFALASYWALIVIAPAIGLFAALGPSAPNAGICFGALFVFVLIGEHGFRAWRRLWRVKV